MATGREHTPEERHELVGEARTVARAATDDAAAPFEPAATGADAVVASLATRAGVDTITPVGRQRSVKRTVLKASQVFLRDQAAFNHLTVVGFEELTARLDAVEARLAELETRPPSDGAAGAGPGHQGA